MRTSACEGILKPFNMKIEIFKSEKNSQFYFRIKARNGKIIAQSEGYNHKRNVHQTIKSLQKGFNSVTYNPKIIDLC